MRLFDLFEKHPEVSLFFNGCDYIIGNKKYDNNHRLSDFIPFSIEIPHDIFSYRFSGMYGSYVDTSRRTYFREENEVFEAFILRALKGARNER